MAPTDHCGLNRKENLYYDPSALFFNGEFGAPAVMAGETALDVLEPQACAGTGVLSIRFEPAAGVGHFDNTTGAVGGCVDLNT